MATILALVRQHDRSNAASRVTVVEQIKSRLGERADAFCEHLSALLKREPSCEWPATRVLCGMRAGIFGFVVDEIAKRHARWQMGSDRGHESCDAIDAGNAAHEDRGLLLELLADLTPKPIGIG